MLSKPLVIVSLLASFAICSNATILLFEGVAPAGSATSVTPGTPYTESGFTLTPSNFLSAVFDAADANKFPGDATSWFGFAGGNTITLTGPSEFNLNSLDVGASTIGTGKVNVTLLGNLVAGGTLSTTFNGLTGATLEALSWIGLSSVQISSTSDSGLDNIDVTATPEPGTLLLLGAGLSVLAARYRFKHAA